MHEALLQYISNHSTSPLREAEVDLIKSIFIPKKIRKRQYFLQEGEVCKYVAFIAKGAMRQYSVDDKGSEHIIRLNIENWWAHDRDSFINQTPSPYFIDAWEDCELLLLPRPDLNVWLKIPALAEMARKMDNNHASALQKRVHDLCCLPAEQRYAELEKKYPELLLRFPQHLIASYLGITKETLSRVRNHVAGK